jgi:hypothetical protein
VILPQPTLPSVIISSSNDNSPTGMFTNSSVPSRSRNDGDLAAVVRLQTGSHQTASNGKRVTDTNGERAI